MKRLRPLAYLLGIVLVVLVLKTVDLKLSWELLKKVQWGWLSAAFLFVLPEVAVKAVRFQLLVQRLNSRLSFRDSADVYLSGQPLALLTPSKVGDIARVLGLKRWAHLSLPTALSVHVADKVYDILALGLLACVGLISLLTQTQSHAPATTILLGIMVGILLMGLFLHPGWMRSIVKPALMSLAPQKLAKQLEAHGNEFYEKLQTLFSPTDRVALPFLVSILAWEVVILRAYFCTLSLGVPLTFSSLALLLPVVVVIEFLPISVLGFGLREGSMIMLFSDQASNSSLISLSILFVLTGPLTAALLGVMSAVRLGTANAKRS